MDLSELFSSQTPSRLEDRLPMEKMRSKWDAERIRSWRILYQRPLSVTFACVALSALSGLALGATPFIAAQEKIYGIIPMIRYSLLFPVLLFGLITLPLGILAGQARNWARWGLLLIGLFTIIVSIWPTPDLCVSLFTLGFVLCASLLFNPMANRFFRLRD